MELRFRHRVLGLSMVDSSSGVGYSCILDSLKSLKCALGYMGIFQAKTIDFDLNHEVVLLCSMWHTAVCVTLGMDYTYSTGVMCYRSAVLG